MPLFAQQPVIQSQPYPQGYFRTPLDLPPDASGTFGELRSNHFHAGTDYRTNQRVGYPLYAVADGTISRIRVQIGGGGNIVYIDHPNGYTSVYMHMHRFNDMIGQAVKDLQYSEQRFDVDVKPEKGRLPVKKGDVIGLAGNSGSSGGPHLHFELRDTQTEAPINSQLFGLTIPDRVPPAISGITVYDLGDVPFSEHTPRRHLRIQGSGGTYSLSPDQIIPVSGKTGFGIITTDQSSTSTFRNGVYSIELLLDDQPVYTAVWEKFFFADSRAINSHIDYPHYILKNQRIQKSFIEPGNPLTIYRDTPNRGIIELSNDTVHRLTYRVRDVAGNTSTLSFRVQRRTLQQTAANPTTGTTLFPFDKENLFKTDILELTLPANTLYSDLYFNYTIGNKPAGGYSAMHHVHNRMTPVHTGYSLAIKPDAGLPPHLYAKALIVDSRGHSHGGRYENGFVRVTARSLGSFYVGIDTIAPVIRPINISQGKSLAGISTINFKISDNLSGIQSFNGYIDDQWVLMEYDPKAASLWHEFDKNLSKGKHRFRLVVTDWKDNEQVFEADFLK